MTERRKVAHAIADPTMRTRPGNVPVIASFQSLPTTDTPYKIRVVVPASELRRKADLLVIAELTRDEAEKLRDDLSSFIGDPLQGGA